MVKAARITALLLASLAALLPAGAQTEQYQQEAGALSVLYRGRRQNVYPYKYNGTYYLETKRFQTGSVQFNGKLYHNVILNLDAYAMELVVKPDPTAGGVLLSPDQVAWFTLGQRRFVNLRYLGFQEVPEGYFELIKDGRTPVLLLTKKLFTPVLNARETPQMDGNFDPEVVDCFVPSSTYYALEDGKLKKLNQRTLNRKLREASGEKLLEGRMNAWQADENLAAGTLPSASPIGRKRELPGGYFDENVPDTTTVTYADNALTTTYRNKIYTVGMGGKNQGGKAVVSGTVLDAESGEPLPGVVIHDEKTATYVRSGAKGQYSLSLPVGNNILSFNADGKEELSLQLNVLSSGTLDVRMTEKITLLKGALISAESMREHRSTIMGVEAVSMKTISKIPSAFGEGDIIKAVLTLPGVKSVGEASGGFNVRGGSADQNLILYNDNTIYNPSHLFGTFSAFNPDLVDQVELYKSSIPAEYGGRLSSVLTVKSKEGDAKQLKGSLGIGLLTSRGHIEGPLNNGRVTFVAGGRIAYSDWLLKLLPKNSAYAGGGAGFGDANLGLTYHVDRRNSVHLFGYMATDRFSFSGDTTFRYTNANASIAWRHKDDDGGSAKLSAGYDFYSNTLSAHYWESGAYDLRTNINQGFVKYNRKRPFGDHNLSYGADLVGYFLDPGIMTPYGKLSAVQKTSLKRETGLETALYASDNWRLTEQLSVDGGLRLSSFLALKPSSKFYMGPEIRLSAKYSPAENLSFKAGFNTQQQYTHLISNTAAVSPMDSWRLSSASIAPTTGWQAAGGVFWTLVSAGLDFSLEGYYKQSRNGLDYKSGATLSMNPNLADDLVPVNGRAYGIEFLLKKPAGKLTGWVSYTYSRSRLRAMDPDDIDAINGGAWYNAPYDKPHEFKLVGNFAFTHRLSFSLNADYSTGRPMTVPIGQYWYGGRYRLAYSARNSHRIPDYFRMDAALNIDPGHYLKAFAHMSVTVGVYNLTGRKNPYSVFFQATPGGGYKAYMLSVFATQVPYINLNVLF